MICHTKIKKKKLNEKIFCDFSILIGYELIFFEEIPPKYLNFFVIKKIYIYQIYYYDNLNLL